MSKNLLIVESPAKSKTIVKYLGKQFQVLASYGHVRDLPAKQGAVKTDEHFAMTYEVIAKNKKHVDAIVTAVKHADALYLATDPDREGEAISWHVLEILKQKKALKNQAVHRVVFHEITESALKEAVAHPRQISMDLVNAQQARRALDYLVGFNLSPLLWKKVRRGLSAGRVQSPALRLIVEREQEIEAFKSEEYWTIEGELQREQHPFKVKLVTFEGKVLKQFDLNNEKDAHAARDKLIELAKGELAVHNIEKKQKKRNPSPPFITSTLQQDAVRKLGFSAKKTMQVAQQLYEGIDTKEGAVGLITYMRTDSVTLSNDALNEARAFIKTHYGEDNLPEKPRVFKTKSKNAQEAHEAIRPTSFMRTPESLKADLSPDQFKLYQLIFKRALASQMAHALIDGTSIDFLCGDNNVLRATGSVIAKPGFLRVYQDVDEEESASLLPAMQVGDKVKVNQIDAIQHFTEPPPRYSEATLVKTLEEFGIGRPSTYASIISTLQQREYVTLENKRFKPSDVGRVVNKFLTEYFTRYVDYGFTANLEDDLDAIARGEREWVPLLEQFWTDFDKQVHTIEANVKRKDVTQEVLDEKCPKCGQPLVIRLGRNGRFIGCSGYIVQKKSSKAKAKETADTGCDYTRSMETDGKEEAIVEAAKEIITDRACPDCGGQLEIKHGRYGKFIGCSNYPKCKHIESLNKPVGTGITCPQCNKGEITEKKSRYGKIFYSCNRYPTCKYALWNQPLNEPCPKCAWPILTLKITKRKGKEKICPQEGCGFSEQVVE